MLITSLCCVLLSGNVTADTLDTYSIQEVEVVQEQRFREVLPAQKLEKDHLERLNVLSVADALRHFSGLQIKDYGGIGGIKTINVRSMGSQHTGIFYDGIELGNAQNGQIDLGQLSMENIESVSLYQGQRSAIFQTASDFGHAGTVYLRTRVPLFNIGEKRHLRIKTQYGSSDLFRLTGLWEQKLSDRLSLSMHIEGLTASGKYPFRYRRLNYDHSVAYDTTATRHNGDVQSLLAEANLFGRFNQGHWSAKAYTFHSNRGIPGAIVNNVWRRGERQSDQNHFIQGQWQRDFASRYSMRIQGKYANYSTHYVNRDSTQFLADNRYNQQEGYLSTSHVVELTDWWSVSAALDYRFNGLDSDAHTISSAHRNQLLSAWATAISYGGFSAQGSLLHTFAHDDKSQSSFINHRSSKLTPALFVRWKALSDLSLHAYAKQSYRLPTFNDLYYTDMGNALLKPETIRQYDLGLNWRFLKADFYHNRVHNKIVAYPKGQQFRWTMLNLGEVEINGIDLTLQQDFQVHRLGIHAMAQYTWQQAIDITSAQDSYYRDQIPYVPEHSGSATMEFDWNQRWFLSYHFNYVGERYSQQENIRYNHLQPWYTSDLNLQYHHPHFRVAVEVLNLLDQQYDVIANYPMPGRNFRCTLCVIL